MTSSLAGLYLLCPPLRPCLLEFLSTTGAWCFSPGFQSVIAGSGKCLLFKTLVPRGGPDFFGGQIRFYPKGPPVGLPTSKAESELVINGDWDETEDASPLPFPPPVGVVAAAT